MSPSFKRTVASCVGAFILLMAFPLAGFAQHAGVCYDASLDTLPTVQGWMYVDALGNPVPTVSGGLLHESTTAGGQYFYRSDFPVDFSQHVTLEASLRVNASNYVANVVTGHARVLFLFERHKRCLA